MIKPNGNRFFRDFLIVVALVLAVVVMTIMIWDYSVKVHENTEFRQELETQQP